MCVRNREASMAGAEGRREGADEVGRASSSPRGCVESGEERLRQPQELLHPGHMEGMAGAPCCPVHTLQTWDIKGYLTLIPISTPLPPIAEVLPLWPGPGSKTAAAGFPPTLDPAYLAVGHPAGELLCLLHAQKSQAPSWGTVLSVVLPVVL